MAVDSLSPGDRRSASRAVSETHSRRSSKSTSFKSFSPQTSPQTSPGLHHFGPLSLSEMQRQSQAAIASGSSSSPFTSAAISGGPARARPTRRPSESFQLSRPSSLRQDDVEMSDSPRRRGSKGQGKHGGSSGKLCS